MINACMMCGHDISFEQMVEQAKLDNRLEGLMELPQVKKWLSQQDTRSTKKPAKTTKRMLKPAPKEANKI